MASKVKNYQHFCFVKSIINAIDNNILITLGARTKDHLFIKIKCNKSL